jgi:ribosomal protein S18 acetylase RimI-like enzyme
MRRIETIRALIGDVLQALQFMQKQQGWGGVFRLLTWPFFEYQRTYVWQRSLSGPIDDPAPTLDVTLRRANLDDLPLFGTIIPRLRMKRFAKKMEAGEVCVIAIREGRIVGFGWVGFPDGPAIRETPLKLGPKEAYAWAGYVSSPYRSYGIATAMGLTLWHWLQEQGYERVLTVVERRNRPAIEWARSAGLEIVAELDSLRLLRWTLARRVPVQSIGAERLQR